MSHESDARTTGIEREFRWAIQALASDPDAQVAALSPGCITCELYEGFFGFVEPYLDVFAETLTESQHAQIHVLREALDEIPDNDCECFNNSVLDRESWHNVRMIARNALEMLGWPLESPPGFHETEPGVWRRRER